MGHARHANGSSAVAGVGGETVGGLLVPAVAGLHSPGRGRGYLAGKTPASARELLAQGGLKVQT